MVLVRSARKSRPEQSERPDWAPTRPCPSAKLRRHHFPMGRKPLRRMASSAPHCVRFRKSSRRRHFPRGRRFPTRTCRRRGHQIREKFSRERKNSLTGPPLVVPPTRLLPATPPFHSKSSPRDRPPELPRWHRWPPGGLAAGPTQPQCNSGPKEQ